MSISPLLLDRSDSKCEICSNGSDLSVFVVSPKSDENNNHVAVICSTCKNQLNAEEEIDKNHWRCLGESMWSDIPAVKVITYRMLESLKAEDWAADLFNMIYLEDDVLEWAQSGTSETVLVHKDCNGNILEAGDTVTLTQDLNVKGANFTAKRGAAVRRIRLVYDNAEQIEGKIDGQQIVILTKFVKKSL